MKVKITCPIQTETDLLQPGIIVEVPDEMAREWIADERAHEVKEQPAPAPKRQVKHGNG